MTTHRTNQSTNQATDCLQLGKDYPSWQWTDRLQRLLPWLAEAQEQDNNALSLTYRDSGIQQALNVSQEQGGSQPATVFCERLLSFGSNQCFSNPTAAVAPLHACIAIAER